MAKFQFADEVQKNLEQQGAVFDENGFIIGKADETVVVPPQSDEEKTAEPEQKAEVKQEQTTTGSDNSQQKEQAQEEKPKQQGESEQEKILRLQREEIADLKAKLASGGSQAPQQSTGPTQREKELEQQIAELTAKTKQDQVDEVRDLLEKQGFDSEILDDDMVLELRDTLVKPIANKLGALEQQIAKMNDRFREPTHAEKIAKNKEMAIIEIQKAIPDFETIFNSREFRQRLSENDARFPTGTYGETLQIAYEQGNHKFIVQEIKNFLGGGSTPSVEQIADVGAGKGVANKAPEESVPKYTFTPEEARKMLDESRMGNISRQEYSEYIAKQREHNAKQHRGETK